MKNIQRTLFHYKAPFVQWKVPWMLKVLHGTKDVRKNGFHSWEKEQKYLRHVALRSVAKILYSFANCLLEGHLDTKNLSSMAGLSIHKGTARGSVTNPVDELLFTHHQRSLAHHIDSCTTLTVARHPRTTMPIIHCTDDTHTADCTNHTADSVHTPYLKENATVFPYSNMFFPQLRRVDMYLSRLSPCT